MNHDALVIGSGPNGLAAAITAAKAGLSVKVYEAASTVGGGASSEELTLPGFIHDRCSAVHPLAVASPFFRSLPLADYGLQWIFPPAYLAHPLEDGRSIVAERDFQTLQNQLFGDADAYERLLRPYIENEGQFFSDVLAPLGLPRHPLLMARFAANAVLSAETLVSRHFRGGPAKALIAGLAAHSFLPLDASLSSAVALVLAVAGHAGGWPIPRGGSQEISNALASCLRGLKGEIELGTPVNRVDELPPARLLFFDVSPRQLAAICANRLPARYLARLMKFKLAPGVFKMDFALSAPVPWKDRRCATAATVHLGGEFDDIARSERDAFTGKLSPRPFVLAAQPSLFDTSRAPAGKHTFWAYCHVPNGSEFDMSEAIVNQVERFAPGFRDLVLARHLMFPQDLERTNRNLTGGDITGGLITFKQLFSRPVYTLQPYNTPESGIYICSASTPPGAGVHGMCGYHAALTALKQHKIPLDNAVLSA